MSTDIRRAVLDAMKKSGITRNQLAVAVAGKVSRSHVYEFVDGTADIGTEKAAHLMQSLGLKVVSE